MEDLIKNEVSIGFDIGISSVGWSVLDCNTGDVLETGVSIFSGASGANNTDRRNFRQSRRLLRRRKTRIKDLRNLLVDYHFINKSDEQLNINNQYELRVKGLSEKLTDKEIAAILLQIAKHRGISYDLGDLNDEDNTGTEFKNSINRNRRELQTKTPGQIQYERLTNYHQVRGNLEIETDDKQFLLRNIYPTEAYLDEVTKILTTQQQFNSKVTDEFIDKVKNIIKRKRDYFKGPGSEKSRTDYGVYKTDGRNLDNLFEELIGKDKFYPDEYRAAANSYTAQLFNLLNDLNNLRISSAEDGHLTKQQKLEIIDNLKTKKSLSGGMLNLIKTVVGIDKDDISGYRKDANNKADIHSMSIYRSVRNKLLANGIDINEWSQELLDKIAFVMNLNTEPGEIRKQLYKLVYDYPEINDNVIDILVNNHTAFNVKTNNKWHRFSIKLMKEFIPELLDTSKEQSTILNERGFIKQEKGLVTSNGQLNIPMITDDIYNPVVTKSIREALKVFNALIKKYSNIAYTVVEMPRENNSDEQKKKIESLQKNNAKVKDAALKEFMDVTGKSAEELEYQLRKKKNSKLFTKIRLWYEQEGKDPYLGKTIDANELLAAPDAYEIDHIIPRSVSFDSRLSNMVLCYASANANKGKRTPYEFMQDSSHAHQSFNEMAAWIKHNKRISAAKANNLLFTDDLNDIEVRKRFIARNLVDTRYASRVILNGLQTFAKESKNHQNMKVTVIRGQFTSWLRKDWNIPKSRDTHHHHAVDATIIASTPKLKLWKKSNLLIPQKVNSELVDLETGEIIDDESYSKLITLPFIENFANTVRHLENSGRIKFHHQVDKKMNRKVSDATIYSTRQAKLQKDKNATEYVVGKINNIYDVNGWEAFKKIYNKDKSKFIMAQKDPKTFNKLENIIDEYPDHEEKTMNDGKVKEIAVSPFELYRRENGYITKYAKRNNGPKVVQIKYYDKKAGNKIDITPKNAKDKHVILQQLRPWRTDVYYNDDTHNYEIMGIKYSDLSFVNGKYGIKSKRYNEIKNSEKISGNSKFMFSLYRNDRIKIMDDQGESVELLFGSRSTSNLGYVELKPIDRNKFVDKQNIKVYGLTSSGRLIKKLSKNNWKLWKVNTDSLGNPYYIEQESKMPKNIIVAN